MMPCLQSTEPVFIMGLSQAYSKDWAGVYKVDLVHMVKGPRMICWIEGSQHQGGFLLCSSRCRNRVRFRSCSFNPHTFKERICWPFIEKRKMKWKKKKEIKTLFSQVAQRREHFNTSKTSLEVEEKKHSICLSVLISPML